MKAHAPLPYTSKGIYNKQKYELREEDGEMAKKVLIVGGVACGAKVAARLRRLDPEAEITVLEKGEHLSYAGCGLPFFVQGIVKKMTLEIRSTG